MSPLARTLDHLQSTYANRTDLAKVFRGRVSRFSDRTAAVFFLLALCCLNLAAAPHPDAGLPEPPTLKPATLAAFERYLKLTEARHDEELQRGTPFFWIDDLVSAAP